MFRRHAGAWPPCLLRVLLALILLFSAFVLLAPADSGSDQSQVQELEPPGLPADLAELERAMKTLAQDCLELRRADDFSIRLQLDFGPVLSAIQLSPLVRANAYGELDAMEQVLECLQDLAKQWRKDPRLAARSARVQGWSYGDLRHLCGFFHWYLSCNFRYWLQRRGLQSGAPFHGEDCGRVPDDLRRAFRGKDFGDILGEMD